MPVQYDPEDAVSTWPDRDASNAPINYQAMLKGVKDTTSKVKTDERGRTTGGNPMQVWTIEVYNGEQSREIEEYVVIPAATFKIKQLARALGQEKEFNAGSFQADDNIGANFIVNLSIEKQEGFDDKNRISKFVPAPKEAAQASEPAAGPSNRMPARPTQRPQTAPYGDEKVFEEDSIPF